MPLIDTNVLVYASGDDHPLRDPCRSLIGAISTSLLRATTSPEAIQEFAHVFARRRERNVAHAQAITYSLLLAPLRTTEADHLVEGLGIWRRHEALGCFDAVLAAIALDSKDATIVSADRAFAEVPGLRHVYPDADGVAGLLG